MVLTNSSVRFQLSQLPLAGLALRMLPELSTTKTRSKRSSQSSEVLHVVTKREQKMGENKKCHGDKKFRGDEKCHGGDKKCHGGDKKCQIMGCSSVEQ